MSGIQPTIGIGPVSTGDGLAQSITDLRRRVTTLEAERTVIGNGSLVGAQIAGGAITGSNIATGSITATNIAAGTITASQIAAGTITAAQIAAGTITAGLIAAGTITGNLIAAGTITATNILAGTITANEIATNTITAANIFAGTITAAQIAAGTIVASNIAAHTITATQIAANSITSTELSVSQLSAITTNMGNITAGTITGGIIQTAATGSRVVVDSAGLRGYALDGVTKVFEINAGSGVASFTGTATLASGSAVPGASITGTISGSQLNLAIGGGNLLVDSSFESTAPLTSTLFAGTKVTIARSTAFAKYGATSLAVTYASGTDPYVNYVVPAATLNSLKGQKVKFSAWIYIPSTNGARVSGTTDRSLLIYDSVTSTAMGIDSIPKDTWTRIVCPVLNISATSAALDLRLYNPYSTGIVYYDGVQLEIGDTATAYAPQPSEITPGSITNAMLGTGIDGTKIGTDTITSSQIAANAITVSELAANAVTAAKIVANTITASQIAANTITAAQIAAATITATEIATGTITANNIAAGTITASKLSVNWSGSNMIKNSGFEYYQYSSAMQNWVAKTSSVISADNTTAWEGAYSAKVASTAAAVSPGIQTSFNYPILASKTYTASAWVQGSGASIGKTVALGVNLLTSAAAYISTPLGSNVTLTSAWQQVTFTFTTTATTGLFNFFAGATTNFTSSGDFFNVDGVQVQPGDIVTPYSRRVDDIAPGEVGATQITPNSLTTNQILAGGINADRITAATITGTQIAANTITAANINVTTLSAITANLGTVTAGTLTGATVQSNSTPTSGGVITDAAGLRAYGARLIAPTPTAAIGGTTTTAFPSTTLTYAVAVNSAIGMSSVGPISNVFTVTTNKYSVVTWPSVINGVSYRVWRSTDGGTTWSAYIDVNEINALIGIYDTGNYAQTIPSNTNWITAGAPFTPPVTNNAINKFFDASTSGGILSGAQLRTSDTFSRIQMDQTDGLTVRSESDQKIFTLNRLTGQMVWDKNAGTFATQPGITMLDSSLAAGQQVRMYLGERRLVGANYSGLAQMVIGAANTGSIGGTAYTGLEFIADTANPNVAASQYLRAYASSGSGFAGRVLLRADTYSEYMKAAVNAGFRTMTVGESAGTINFSGAAGCFVTIGHDLGATPKGAVVSAVVMANTSDPQSVVTASPYSWDASSITFKFQMPSYLGGANGGSFWFMAWT